MATKKKDYQELRADLDAVMQKLQSGDVSVDEAVSAYEQGMKLIEQLQEQLTKAENKIEKIKTDFEARGKKT